MKSSLGLTLVFLSISLLAGCTASHVQATKELEGRLAETLASIRRGPLSSGPTPTAQAQGFPIPPLVNAYLRANPSFEAFSESQSNLVTSIERKLAALDPGGVDKCSEKLARYKDICLGVSIQSFAQKYRVQPYLGEKDLQEIFKSLDIRLDYQRPGRAKKDYFVCSSVSPDYSDSGDLIERFTAPASISHFKCVIEETILGFDSDVVLGFVNGRLTYIQATVNLALGLRDAGAELLSAFSERLSNQSGLGEEARRQEAAEVGVRLVGWGIYRAEQLTEQLVLEIRERRPVKITLSAQNLSEINLVESATNEFFESAQRARIRRDF
jgi:hypothetical protein